MQLSVVPTTLVLKFFQPVNQQIDLQHVGIIWFDQRQDFLGQNAGPANPIGFVPLG